MFNNRQSDVIERNTYIDEFEKTTSCQSQVNTYDEEKEAFNAKIASNFDKLLRVNIKDVQSEILERNRVYDKYSTAINTDNAPSQTTMQYRGMPRAEIYQDYRVDETQYQAAAVQRPRAKLLMLALSFVILALSVLVVFNTALLNNMNTLIDQKTEQIEVLRETKSQYESALNEVSNIDNIKDIATGNGMVE